MILNRDWYLVKFNLIVLKDRKRMSKNNQIEHVLRTKFKSALKSVSQRIKDKPMKYRKNMQIEVCYVQKQVQDYGFYSTVFIDDMIAALDNIK